jgi:transcriptional regulator with XRE-family HTH domain
MEARQRGRVCRPLRLRRERQRRGWSQFRTGIEAGIEPSTLCQIELGRRPAYPRWRERLAAVFGMSAETLFAEDDENENGTA